MRREMSEEIPSFFFSPHLPPLLPDHGPDVPGRGHLRPRPDHERAGGQAGQGGHGRVLVGRVEHL